MVYVDSSGTYRKMTHACSCHLHSLLYIIDHRIRENSGRKKSKEQNQLSHDDRVLFPLYILLFVLTNSGL